MSDLMAEKISYGGWPNCYRLSNKIVDVVVTADVGPRIIRFGFVDQGNMFKEYPEMLGKVGGNEWRIYGGHRFWHAPEDLRQSLLPTATIAVWSYTDLSDPRWTWGRRYILLRQDANATSSQKIGLGCEEGWVVYAHANGLFLKRFVHEPGKIYSDLGASVETFTNSTMLEVETLGPLQRLEPDGTVEHVEQWFLLPPVAQPQNDADVDRDIISVIIDCN
jgi:hypothetical protein